MKFKQKTLSYYADEISKSSSNPGLLVNLLTEMTVDYAMTCDFLIPLERARCAFWLEHKQLNSERPVSDRTLEMMWMDKGDGIIQRRAELYKKALEKMMSNLKAIIREKENEAKNFY